MIMHFLSFFFAFILIVGNSYAGWYGDVERATTEGGGGGGSGGGNSFETISVPAGTNPVADSSTDTLNITETSSLVITGTAGTDTIDITWDTLVVGDGGTGATTLTDGGILLGSGTGAITPLGVATNGQIPVGDGTTDPVLATITGTADEITVTNGAGTITLDIPDPLIAGKGGTGAASLTDGGILLGSGTGAVTPLGVAANGQIPIGDGTTDPVLASITGTANEVTVTDGAGSITLSLPNHAGTDISADLEEEGAVTDTNAVKEYWWPASATLPLQNADAIPPIAKDAGTNVDQLVVDFDDSIDECRGVSFKVPSDVQSGSTITFVWHGYSAAATTGAVMLDFRHNSGVADGVDPDVALTTESATSDTVPGTAGQVSIVTWTETLANTGFAANDQVDGYFCRDGDGTAGTDSLAGDWRTTGVGVQLPRA